MTTIDVITEDLKNHPICPHGPTILFARQNDGRKRKYFACSACRDRKQCGFFLWEDERNTMTNARKDAWEQERKNYLKNINHRKTFLSLNEVKNLPKEKRIYCQTCSRFEFERKKSGTNNKHEEHTLINNISDYQLCHPSEILTPIENAKKEAQFLFSKESVATLVNILRDLNYRDVICMGTPRLHEHILSECKDMTSLLLDIDHRFHNFFGPLEFCWYNSFNHHFFLPESKKVFDDFLRNNNGKSLVLITDPPFGGRVEPLAYVINLINNQFKMVNNSKNDLPIFWIFPYFMEPQIMQSLPNFHMLDYKVEYENHPLFQNEKKNGSPVRVFTNVSPGAITLPEDEGYRYCKQCNRWVSKENKHCKVCESCTSKNGRTYVHCSRCEKCVKPSWQHCDKCNRCALVNHICGDEEEQPVDKGGDCFHCKKPGHKKRDCPDIDQAELFNKRKKGMKNKVKKKQKMN